MTSRNIFKIVSLLMLTGIIQIPIYAQEPPIQSNTEIPSPGVVISEVYYWPKQAESEWVELTNASDEPIDVKGWQLIDGQVLDFVISNESLIMPPKSYLVILLDGTGEPSSQVADLSLVVHSPIGIGGNVLGDKGGQLGLYLPLSAPFGEPVIRSYVAWGNSPGRVLADAMKRHLWSSNSDVILGTDLSRPIFGPARLIKPGGSIGLIQAPKDPTTLKQWGVFNPSDVTQGESGIRKRKPVTYLPFGDKTSEDGTITLSAVPEGEETVKYRFQVCSDKGCTSIFLDSVAFGPAYSLEKPIPRNTTYYWRVQMIYPDGTESSWSDSRNLTNGYPK